MHWRSRGQRYLLIDLNGASLFSLVRLAGSCLLRGPAGMDRIGSPELALERDADSKHEGSSSTNLHQQRPVAYLAGSLLRRAGVGRTSLYSWTGCFATDLCTFVDKCSHLIKGAGEWPLIRYALYLAKVGSQWAE